MCASRRAGKKTIREVIYNQGTPTSQLSTNNYLQQGTPTSQLSTNNYLQTGNANLAIINQQFTTIREHQPRNYQPTIIYKQGKPTPLS